MTVQFLQLAAALLATSGGVASIYSLWHAKDRRSPEPPSRGPIHVTLLAVSVVILGAVAGGIAGGCRRGCEAEWVALVLFAATTAAVALGLGRQCKVRERAWRRWNGPWGVAGLLLAVLATSPGCSFVHKGDLTAWGFLTEIDAEVLPDGTIRAKKSSQTEFAKAVVGEAIRASK